MAAASTIVKRTPRGDEMFHTLARRAAAHVIDFECFPLG
jgi:hypothetical protein